MSEPDWAPRGEPRWYRSDAFGLTVDCDWPLTGSAAASEQAAPPARRAVVTRARTPEFDEAWAQSADPIFEHRADGGPASFTVERSSDHYRFWFEGFGRYLVSTDGARIACEAGAAARPQQERFVLAHALPVAAVLQGFEVLHVSAVAAGGSAAAFAGASGTGKTRMASRLVARGAEFLTDDVLAVETAGEHVVAYPGPALMSIRSDDTAMLAEIGGRLGTNAGTTDKVHVSPHARGPVSRLRVIYHIHWGETFEISALAADDLHRILALSFVPYLAPPERLLRHLAIAQAVNTDVAQFRLQTPGPDLHEEMLARLETHLRDVTA